MSLFQTLSALSNRLGDRIHMEMTTIENGQFRVMVTPDLGVTPANAGAEETDLRAALSAPLTITGTPQEIDALLTEHVQRRAPAQQAGAEALATLEDRIRAAASKASKAKPEAGKAKSGGKASASPQATEPETPAAPVKAPTLEDSF